MQNIVDKVFPHFAKEETGMYVVLNTYFLMLLFEW